MLLLNLAISVLKKYPKIVMKKIMVRTTLTSVNSVKSAYQGTPNQFVKRIALSDLI